MSFTTKIDERYVATPPAQGMLDTAPGAAFNQRVPGTPTPGPLASQVGGSHYKDMAIQPVEYIHRNKLGFCEGSVIKYVTRWRAKGGVADLEKARHFIDLLIELEQGGNK